MQEISVITKDKYGIIDRKIIEDVTGEYFLFSSHSLRWNSEDLKRIGRFFFQHPDYKAAVCRLIYEEEGGNHRLHQRFRKKFKGDFVPMSDLPIYVCPGIPGMVYNKEAYLRAYDQSPIKNDKFISQFVILESKGYGIIGDVTFTLNRGDAEPKDNKEITADDLIMLVKVLREKFGENSKGYLSSWLFYEAALMTQYENPVSLLWYIEDETIAASVFFTVELRVKMLRLKYGPQYRSFLKFDSGKVICAGKEVCNLRNNKNLMIISSMEIRDKALILYGKVRNVIYQLLYEDLDIYLNIKGAGQIKIEKTRYQYGDMDFFNGTEKRYTMFYASIPLQGKYTQVTPEIHYKDERIPIYSFQGKHSSLSNLEHTYSVQGSYILSKNEKTWIVEKPLFLKTAIYHHEWKLQYLLRKQYKQGEIAKDRLRILKYKLSKKKEQIWIFSDRESVAGDNGEYLFRYAAEKQKETKQKIHPYFLISDSCGDYQRMQQFGDVIAVGSKEHRKLLLSADLVISSSGNNFIFDAYSDQRNRFYQDMRSFQYVFLQHGVTKDDISGWLNRTNKNIRMFVTSSKEEYQSILDGNYGYTGREVKLVGMARFDNLIRSSKNPERRIVILPTWRKSIKGSYNAMKSESIYYDKFTSTEFYQFYDSLINHPKLLQAMRECKVKGAFGIHPIHNKQSKDFHGNDVFEIIHGNIDYQSEFERNRLLITDYSSVAFDFGYLRKPVIYTQFDKKEFFQSHAYTEGYFDYERDGFGPVCQTLEETVEEIIRVIKSNFALSPKYRQKINNFFEFEDDKNCERIWNEILRINTNG